MELIDLNVFDFDEVCEIEFGMNLCEFSNRKFSEKIYFVKKKQHKIDRFFNI